MDLIIPCQKHEQKLFRKLEDRSTARWISRQPYCQSSDDGAAVLLCAQIKCHGSQKKEDDSMLDRQEVGPSLLLQRSSQLHVSCSVFLPPPLIIMFTKILLLATVLGVAVCLPQGYNYNTPAPPPPPQQPPSNLYQTPQQQPRPAPVRPTSAPPRPSTGYGQPAASNPVPSQSKPPASGMEGMPYDFQWGVDDSESGNAFSHVENSDGQTTQGEYRVLLPDGRTQVVKFFDNGGGFNAEVIYE
ncbi:Insect cuticle protein [Trinorchestia longiramus]|nr:Insect cuticle protein [Trinorchestia longiramus]